MPKTPVILSLVTGVAMLFAGASPWLALAVTGIWIASIWLARPAPEITASRDGTFTISRGTIAPFIEPLGVPLLMLDADRIVAANRAARDALGSHIVGQDARVALRLPEAISLLTADSPQSVVVSGLTAPRSLWQVSQFRIDDRFRLIEFVNRTAEADISRAHTDFVANASHELRTPLASIIGYLETLRDAGESLDPASREKFLATMDSEARRMRALVDDLMSLSRIEAEKHDAPRDDVDLAALVRSVVKDVSEVRGANRVVQPGSMTTAVVHGEASQLDQLVRNLIDNAIKYGGSEGPVEVVVSQDPRWVMLRVTDSGPGIAREHLPHLTRRFYRTDPARSRASGGTGLGLAIVKHIVERHQGDLDIASVEGQGTVVTVRLPRTDSQS